MKFKLLMQLATIVSVKPFVCAQGLLPLFSTFGNDYWIGPDVVHGVENGHENKLDVIYPHNATRRFLPSFTFMVADGPVQ
jgi:hypothetical protein